MTTCPEVKRFTEAWSMTANDSSSAPRRVVSSDSITTRSVSSTQTLLTNSFRSKPSSGEKNGEEVNKNRVWFKLSQIVETLRDHLDGGEGS